MWWWHSSGWGWLAMAIGMAAFWIAIALVVLALVRNASPGRPSGRSRAEEILSERYARGEIDTDEYRTRTSELRARHRD